MGYPPSRRALDRTVKKYCKKVSLELNIPVVVVEEVVYQYYKNIADTIEGATPGKPEEFLNFSIPRIGKLFTKDARVMKIHNNASKNNDRKRGGAEE